MNRSAHTPESDAEYTRRRRSIDGDVDAEFIIIYLLKNENGSASERRAPRVERERKTPSAHGRASGTEIDKEGKSLDTLLIKQIIPLTAASNSHLSRAKDFQIELDYTLFTLSRYFSCCSSAAELRSHHVNLDIYCRLGAAEREDWKKVLFYRFSPVTCCLLSRG